MLVMALKVTQWCCSSCSTFNYTDKETQPCTNCHCLDSQNNLKRASALYLLGNIAKPSVNLIPLKKPFFIYPLAAPLVTYQSIENTDNDLIYVYFRIDLYDVKGIEKYHIEKVKFDVGNNTESFVLHSLTPYYNVFTKQFNKRQYNGVYNMDICVKCYGSERVSSKQRIQMNLCHTPVPLPLPVPSLIGITSDLEVDDKVFVEQKNFESMSVKELKEECRKYRFYVSGNKTELILRLRKPLEYINQRKREYHKKKYGKSNKRLIFSNYIWKNGKILEKKGIN
eukprot:650570_1